MSMPNSNVTAARTLLRVTFKNAIATELVRNSTRRLDNGRLRWKIEPQHLVTAPPSGEPSTSTPTSNLWPMFDLVRAPVLVVRGAESHVLTPGIVTKMCSRHPASKAVEVPGVGHAPWLSEPVALAALREFLRT